MVEEKVFTINLRRKFSKKPIYQKTKKAVKAVKKFIVKHLKVKEVKIGKNLNNYLWKQGKRSPPPRVKVNAYVEEKTAYIELEGFRFEKPAPKEEEKKTIADKLLGKKAETQKTSEEASKEEKTKKIEKEEIKESPKERQAEQKKEHMPEIKEKPGKEIKQREKIKEDIGKYNKVIPETGKKGAKEAKP